MNIGDVLRDRFGDAARARVPLAAFTTFRIGGPADWLLETRSSDEVLDALRIAHEAGVAVTILGGGSNVLVSDAGVRGLVIRPRGGSIAAVDDRRVRADAAVTLNGVVRWTIGRGLGGLEAWAGTPGTVGGAVFGNAHWNRVNIGELIDSVRVASLDGVERLVEAGAMEFGYDRSRLQRTREVLLSATFHVTPGDSDALRSRARESLAYRKRTQPLALPSAGCVFQNPDPARDGIPAGIPASAGALIDRAGLKGYAIGGARVSPVHANFIVNEGSATAADVQALVELCRTTVRERFGVVLRDEIVRLGEF